MSDIFESDRRTMLQRVFVLLGVASTATSVPALAKVAKAAKPSLAAPLFNVLSAVADTLIPRTDTAGAVDARVPALLDGLLVNWASPQRRSEMTEALTKVDRIALAKEGKGFAALTPAQRTVLLKAHETEAMKVIVRPGDGGIKSMLSGPNYADPGYGKIKELIVLLYYLSEPALTQELTYVHAPGKWKPSIPVTPATRPAAGGMF